MIRFRSRYDRPSKHGNLLRPLIVSLVALIALVGRHASPATQPLGGSWVWCSKEEQPVNAYAYFRRTFTLPAAPSAATLKVTADTRYVLYVNGQRIGRGPARSYTATLAVDTWNIAGALQPGKNVVAALVHHVGESTFRNQAGRAGFLCDASITVNGQAIAVRTDATWKALASEAWDRAQARMNIALGFAEVYDARKAPVGWTDANFDDTAWPAATVLGPAGMAPWTNLSPTDIPPNRETILRPATLVDSLEVEAPPDAARLPFGRLYTRNAWAVGYAATFLYAPRDTSVILQVGGDDGLRLWVNGTLALERTAPRAGYPAQDAVTVPLTAGWNRVLLKSARLVGPWNAFLAATGPGAEGVFASSERDAGQKDAWRISPECPFDASKGLTLGLSTVFAPENASDYTGWAKIQSPVAPWNEIGPMMRHESRRHPQTPRVLNATSLVDASGAATFQSTGRSGGAVVLDMGRTVLGYPVFTVRNARGGEIVDVGYVEALEDARGIPVSPASGAAGIVNPARGDVNYADRFICRPGDNVFEPFTKRGFRYMQIDVRNAPQPLALAAPTVTEALYPVLDRGQFACSDERLNRIWEAGRETLRLNMDDAYTDCVWRERTQWWGDATIEAGANYYAFGDLDLVRRGLILGAQSQDSEGIVRGLFPTDWYGSRIPSYSLLWVVSLWEYYQYSGDATLFPTMLPVIDRLMGFFDGRMNPSLGLLENVPYWVFIDWAPGMDGQRSGASASLNAFYYRALLAASDIARVEGDSARTASYAAKAASLKEAFNQRFWNPTQGLYEDILTGGQLTGRFTQHANALAISYGLAPSDRWTGILSRITTDPNVIKTGTPYFGTYLLDALFTAGRPAEAAQYMRDRWGRMLDWGSPTFWETWEPTQSLTHGWSSGPTMLLPARVLGLRPLEPGWKQWTLSPSFAGLQWARASVPTPYGNIDAYWTMRSQGLHMNLRVPTGTTAVVWVPIAGLESARWTVMQGTRPATGIVRENISGQWAIRLTKPGDYTIQAVRDKAASRPLPAGPATGTIRGRR